MAEETKLDDAAKKAGTKKTSFICETKCFWNKRLWHKGDTLEIGAGEKVEVPEHFKKVE